MDMAIRLVSRHQVVSDTVEVLGFDSSAVSLMSNEGLAASLRRAASFLCPTTTGSLIRAVVEVLSGLPDYSDECPIELERLVELLVAYGDLLELPVDDGNLRRRQLFLGPPAFVRRATNACLLIGIRAEGAPLLGEDVLGAIEHERHVRVIQSLDERPTYELLESYGLIELRPEQWLKAPRQASPGEVVDFYDMRLDSARMFDGIEGVRVIDPLSKVTYYKGRWRPLRGSDNGRFVARRPQAFGADLWCFAEVARGEVVKLIDLPLQSIIAAGADEAWRLQAAIDTLHGQPQMVRTRAGTHSNVVVLDLFSPVPSWLQRRLDFLGTPILGAHAALLSYAFPQREVAEELQFLEAMMWMSPDGSMEA
jgi:hypothetical protein